MEGVLRADPFTAYAFRAIWAGGFAESVVVTSFAAMSRITSTELRSTPTYREGYEPLRGYAELQFAALLDKHRIVVRAGPSRFCPVRSVLHRVMIDDQGQLSKGLGAGRSDPQLCVRARRYNWLLRALAIMSPGVMFVVLDWLLGFICKYDGPCRRLNAPPSLTVTATVALLATLSIWLVPEAAYWRYVLPLSDERTFIRSVWPLKLP